MIVVNKTRALMKVDIPSFSYPVKGFREFSLKKINLTINEKDAIGIIGESGSGKSTLIKILAGLLPLGPKKQVILNHLSEGWIPVKDIDRKKRYASIQIVFQDNTGTLYPKESIASLLSHIAKIKKIDKTVVRKRAEEFFYLLGLFNRNDISEHHSETMNSFLTKQISDLSMGMLRRFCLAKSVLLLDIYSKEDLLNPKILLLDEISRGLDYETKQMLIAFINKTLRDQYNLSIVAISHELNFLKDICNSFCVLFDGYQFPGQYTIDHLRTDGKSTVNNPYLKHHFLPGIEPEKPEFDTDEYLEWDQFMKCSPCIFVKHYNCKEKDKDKCINIKEEYPWICN